MKKKFLKEPVRSVLWSKIAGAGAVGIFSLAAASPASALEILDGWNLNLSVANGETVGATTYDNLGDAENIDRVNVSGNATIEQQVSGGSALDQPFTESGFLRFQDFEVEGGGFGNFDLGDNGQNLYTTFEGLTGTLNADETITFDPGVGTIKLWLDSDTDSDPTTGDALELAAFSLIAPSGGSDLDFFGGTAANSTIDVTAEVLSVIAPGLFTDMDGNDLDTFIFGLVNVDSLLDDDFVPNPDNSGVVGGEGTSLIYVENGGQFRIAQVPEPGMLSLLGIGLLGLGLGRRGFAARQGA